MTPSLFRSVIVIGALIGCGSAAYAQQAQESTTPPAATTATPPAASPPAAPTSTTTAAQKTNTETDPTDEQLKKARQAGYHTKVKQGVVYYCKSEAEIGTHFKTEHCLDENQLAMTLQQEQAQRDQLQSHVCSSCGGGK